MPDFEPIQRMCEFAKRKHDCDPSEAPRPTKRPSTCTSGILNSSDESFLGVSPVETLPQEVLLQVFEHLVDPSLITAGFPDKKVNHYSDADNELYFADRKPICRKDLRNVCLVSRKFKLAATTLLYRCTHLAIAKAPDNLVSSLQAHQELQSLVKHISVPTYQGVLTYRYDFTFLHDTINWLCYDTDAGVPVPPPLKDEFYAEFGKPYAGSLLRRMLELVPQLRTLVIPQFNFYGGPYTKDMVLFNLTMLRITLMTPNEVTFYTEGTRFSISTLRWLHPAVLHERFPSLRRLEVYTPNGKWEADLVTEKPVNGPPAKFVESLTTTALRHEAPAEWDMMSLYSPIFNSSKFHTLKFAGPGLDCRWVTSFPYHMEWNLNRFLSGKGAGLRTLSLDWECHNTDEDIHSNRTPQEVYFGPTAAIINLHELSSLTHLTISLQALFGDSGTFDEWAEAMEDDMEAEITKLLPPSLRTLRIAEYAPGVHEAGWILLGMGNDEAADADGEDIRMTCLYVQNFLKALRFHWLLHAEGRELWFRRYALLDRLAAETGRGMGRAGLEWILDGTSKGDDGFERVTRPAQDMTWKPWEDLLEEDVGWDPEEPLVLGPPVGSHGHNWSGPGLEETTGQLKGENVEQPDKEEAEQLETEEAQQPDEKAEKDADQDE